MFSIFKFGSKREAIDLSLVKVDMHSHLLPGIDDGSTGLDSSERLIKGLRELGFQQLITTPHIMWDLYKNTADIISGTHLELITAQPDLQPLRYAAEYFLDDHFEKLLVEKTPLLTIHENLVLVEFSFVNPPLNWKDIIFNLQLAGYRPILAHPERYTYIANQKKFYDELKSAGCLFQLNLLSLTGYYNKTAAELSQYLLQQQMIDLVGTDMHHARHLDALSKAGEIMPLLNRLLDSGRLLNPTFSF